jgi:hypothetical protein
MTFRRDYRAIMPNATAFADGCAKQETPSTNIQAPEKHQAPNSKNPFAVRLIFET